MVNTTTPVLPSGSRCPSSYLRGLLLAFSAIRDARKERREARIETRETRETKETRNERAEGDSGAKRDSAHLSTQHSSSPCVPGRFHCSSSVTWVAINDTQRSAVTRTSGCHSSRSLGAMAQQAPTPAGGHTLHSSSLNTLQSTSPNPPKQRDQNFRCFWG